MPQGLATRESPQVLPVLTPERFWPQASGRGPYWHPKGRKDDTELNRAALPEPPLRPTEPAL